MLQNWLIFLLLFCVSYSEVLYVSDNPLGGIEIWPIEEEYNPESIHVNGINGAIYKAWKRYYCSLFDNAEDRQTLLYGAQGWVFPRQDVNLTLAYPSADWDASLSEDHVITGYQVILFTDGLEGSAYINTGGLMEDNLSMTFISNQITSLYYQFWLYGAPRGNVFDRIPANSC